jgi:hypothetical protein
VVLYFITAILAKFITLPDTAKTTYHASVVGGEEKSYEKI